MAHGGQWQTSSRKLHRHYLVAAGRRALSKRLCAHDILGETKQGPVSFEECAHIQRPTGLEPGVSILPPPF